MDNNKILTVSYGTFSCTLEGFEDSFGTMKAIAEYFRDLASEDRYFGAEPPQPDAGLLARIAEREASQRVEAHEHEGRIMLKAREEDAKDETSDDASEETKGELTATETQKTTAASEPLVEPETTELEVKPAQTHDAEVLTPEASVEEDVLDQAPNIELSTSEKNISVSEEEDHASGTEADVVEPGHEEAQDVTSVETLRDKVKEETLEAQTSVPDAPLEQQNTPEETSDVPKEELPVCDKARDTNQEQTPDPMANVATFFAKSVVGNQADMDTEEEPCAEVLSGPVPYPRAVREPVEDVENSVPAAPANRDISDSLAEKLQRIRAVVSKNDGPDVEIVSRDAHMESAPELDAETVNEAVEEAKAQETESSPGAEAEQSSAQAFNLSAFATASTTEAVNEEDVDELDLLLRRIENGEALDMFDVEAEATEDALEHESSGGMFYHQGEGVQKDPIVDSQAFTLEDSEGVVLDDEPADAEETVRNDKSRTASSNETESSDELDASAKFAGRILKVERAKLEEALEAGELEEIESNQNPLQAKDVEQSQPLAATDSSDLSEQTLADFSSVSKPTHAKLPEIDLDTGEDVSRLMAETEQQMKEPDGETRRSAFSHLRAAVAARFADKSIDENIETEEQAAEAYKSDLAEAVTPQRKHDAAQTDGPADTVVAPLQLVAEQRVDLQSFAPRGPVAPRRVAASDIDDLRPSEDNGFGYYAEQRGASSLSERLEAAAAYLSFVEGYEQFTRPQLMSRARMAGSDDFSREEGLRSFGQLLRTGKIKKIKGGRFAASDSIGFKPDHRAAG